MSALGCFLVDVDAPRRATVRGRLVAAGLRVVPLASVERALAVIRGIAPDVVVVDLHLPAGHLEQLAAAIRADVDTRHAALLGIGTDIAHARAAGFDAVVARDVATIGADVRRCFSRGRIRLVERCAREPL